MEHTQSSLSSRGEYPPVVRMIRNACGGAGAYISRGWQNVFDAMGWQYKVWNGRNPERTFEEFAPDIYMADVRMRHWIPTRIKRGQTLVIATADQWASPWLNPEDARNGYRTKWYDRIWIRMLNPAFLFHQTTPEGIQKGWNKWTSAEGIPVHSFMVAGDTFDYLYDGPPVAALECDVAYVGGYWPYKSSGLNDYLLDRLQGYRYQIYGSGWPKGISKGRIDTADIKLLFKSARFVPCIHEPHSRLYGYDIVQRLFMVPLAGGFTISDPVRGIHGEGIFSEDEMIVADSANDMWEKAAYFISHPEARQRYTERARARVLREHTYFHRVGTMLRLLGFRKALDLLKAKMLALGLGSSTLE